MLIPATTVSLLSASREAGLQDPDVVECLADLDAWCARTGASFGITGSALTDSGKGINDLDLVLVAPNSVVTDESVPIVLPQRFASRAWNSYLVHFGAGTVHAYVTHCPQNTKIRLEFYPLCIAERILRLNQFVVRRLGQSPLSSAARLFRGTNGESKSVPAIMANTDDAYFGEFPSCIWENGVVYVGVHLACIIQGAVKRRWSIAGESPARELVRSAR
jgi:hypothetical protein